MYSHCFISVPPTITAQQCEQGEGENLRFIVESEFLFSQNRSFLLMVFSKFLFSQELCQKMALLYTEHSSPLKQVINRSGKTAAQKSIRLTGNKFAFVSHRRTVPLKYAACPGVILFCCCLTRSLCLKAQISLCGLSVRISMLRTLFSNGNRRHKISCLQYLLPASYSLASVCLASSKRRFLTTAFFNRFCQFGFAKVYLQVCQAPLQRLLH